MGKVDDKPLAFFLLSTCFHKDESQQQQFLVQRYHSTNRGFTAGWKKYPTYPHFCSKKDRRMNL